MTTIIKSEQALKTQSELMLRASRKNDKAINKDSSNLSEYIVTYLKDVTVDNGAWNLERLTKTIYEFAGYNPKGKTKDGESLKSPSFETRVKRATFDALLEFYSIEPSAQPVLNADGSLKNDKRFNNPNGYKRVNGVLTLPHNIIKPVIMDVIEGVKQELPNNDKNRVPVSLRLREKHFAQVFKGFSQRQANVDTGKIDIIKMASDLNIQLIKLKTAAIVDMPDSDTKILKELENTLDKFFETRATHQITKEGNIINTAIKKAS